MAKAIWEYIHGYASKDRPEMITFFDRQDDVLYREVPLKTIGAHGWELVSVIYAHEPGSPDRRYEYFFKRNRAEGYDPGFGRSQGN